MKFIPFLFKNVFRKKTRSVLTIFSIVLPLILICLMGSFFRVLDNPRSEDTKGMFRLVTRHKVGLSNPIPSNYADKIEDLDGVLAVTKFNWFGGTYIDSSAQNNFARFAVEPKTFFEVFDDGELIEGSVEDWEKDPTGCMVGEDLINKFGWEIGDKVVLVGNIHPVTLELTIRGIYRTTNDNSGALFLNRKYLEEALPTFKGTVGTIWMKTRDVTTATQVSDKIDRMFENSSHPTKTESEKAFQMGFVSMLGNVKLLITSMGITIILVIILIAANTISISARERIREIAVLRTLGYRRSMILSFILGESVILALIGGLIGVLTFVIAFEPLKSFLLTTPMGGLARGLEIYPEVIILGFIISIFVGLFAGIVPAIGASNRPITEGIRYIG